jgi:hypothetical protein
MNHFSIDIGWEGKQLYPEREAISGAVLKMYDT